MTEAQLALIAMQGIKVLITTAVNAYNRKEITDEELVSAWGAMKVRLASVSQQIQS